MAEVGPICKKAEDLIPLLKVLIQDKISLLNLDAEVDITQLNIFYQENSGDIRASKINYEMRTALLKVVQHFKEINGSITKVSLLYIIQIIFLHNSTCDNDIYDNHTRLTF